MKTMYDVVERANEALQKDEKLNLEKLQSYADDTKDMVATKVVRHILKKIQKDILIQERKAWFTF